MKSLKMNTMLRSIFLSLVVFVSLNTLQAQEPFFELKDLDNEWTDFEALKGEKLTVIDFWATWCQPCLKSIPELNAIYSEYKELGVNLIGISVDGPRNQSKLKPFAKSMGIEYPILRDINSEVMTEMNVSSVPTLMIYDEDGELLFIHQGFRPGDETVIREHIEEALQ